MLKHAGAERELAGRSRASAGGQLRAAAALRFYISDRRVAG